VIFCGTYTCTKLFFLHVIEERSMNVIIIPSIIIPLINIHDYITKISLLRCTKVGHRRNQMKAINLKQDMKEAQLRKILA
jgi:hypothetical protein